MIVNNLELIKALMTHCDEGEFYTIHILHRSKDGHTKYESPGKKYVQQMIKTYYISSTEYLDYKMTEIIDMCHMFNARAYINLNKKSWRQVTQQSLCDIAQIFRSEEYRGVKSLVESACGETGAVDGDKRWIVDVDTKDFDEIKEVVNAIYKSKSKYDDSIISYVPTVHGVHIITHPFNLQDFENNFKKKIDIHKNNPTLLYYKTLE